MYTVSPDTLLGTFIQQSLMFFPHHIWKRKQCKLRFYKALVMFALQLPWPLGILKSSQISQNSSYRNSGEELKYLVIAVKDSSKVNGDINWALIG